MTTDDGQPDNLLLVEDNPGDLRLIKEVFDTSKFETTLHTVSTGEQALEFITQRGEYENAPEPDVILLDWTLPTMSAEEVLSEIQAHDSEIPVVVMSGTRAEVEAIKSIAAQIDSYLTKPSDPAKYVKAIESLY